MEFLYRCACGASEAWTSELASQAAAMWHIRRAHPELWAESMGPLGDVDPPDPATLGRQFETWERQS